MFTKHLNGYQYAYPNPIQTGAKYGMQTLDAHLTSLYKEGLISYEELITKSQDPDSVVQKLKEEMGE